MAEKLLIGIDVGTSSVKGLVCDTTGRLVAQAAREHTLHAPRPGWAEEDPHDWQRNVTGVIRACLAHPDVNPRRIVALGVTGMVPAVVLLDHEGQPLRPSIQQNDARAVAEIAALNAAMDPEAFFRRTGAALSQQSVGPKLLWLQRHEPDIWAKTRHITGSYGYINARLTGVVATEWNWALESGLYDLHTQQWGADLLANTGVTPAQLPPIHRPEEIIGAISAEAAAATGLPEGLPVATGAADHVGAALAAGIRSEGDLLVKFGSAGDILYSTDTLILDPRLYLDYHTIPGKYLLNGCMASSGSLLRWYVETFCGEDIQAAQSAAQDLYPYLDAQAAGIPAGSNGVIVLPYFLGEKTPVLDPAARGVIFGLTLFHQRPHVYRAILEAVAFGFKHHVDVLEEHGLTVRQVVAEGPGARSPLWLQITADILERPIAPLVNTPGAALAAAFVAGMGAGVFDSWADIERFVTPGDVVEPTPAHRAVYTQQYGIYRELYPRLKGLLGRMSEWGNGE